MTRRKVFQNKSPSPVLFVLLISSYSFPINNFNISNKLSLSYPVNEMNSSLLKLSIKINTCVIRSPVSSFRCYFVLVQLNNHSDSSFQLLTSTKTCKMHLLFLLPFIPSCNRCYVYNSFCLLFSRTSKSPSETRSLKK